MAVTVAQLSKKLSLLEKKLALLEEKAKVDRRVEKVVFEREGTQIKVRAHVFLKKLTGGEYVWQDVTDKFSKAKREEIINGA